MALPEALARLRGLAGVAVEADDRAREAAAHDFGGLCRGRVRAVVAPQGPAALATVVELARESALAVVPRGGGLGQSGQSIPRDGLSVDMRAFTGIELDAEAGRVRCGSAVHWRELFATCAAAGWAPEVVPLNLDLSVGGTLSAGGTGSTSHRYGMAVSAVESMVVVTGTGECVETRADRRPEVFEAVLGGVGRFGFICSVELRLRRLRPRLRTWFLLYDDLPTLLADERALMNEDWCTHLEGFASAAMQGLKIGPAGRGRVPLARWFYGLQLSEEYEGAEPDTASRLAGLGFRELVHVQDDDPLGHAARYDLRFRSMAAAGQWTQAHPWFECLVPPRATRELLPRVIEGLPAFLGDGHRVMPVAARPRPRFCAFPEQGPATAFAVLPTGVPPHLLEPALGALGSAHEQLLAAGGKRYLSGWLFEPDERAWQRHFGADYEAWQARRRLLDPDGLFRSCLAAPPAGAPRSQRVSARRERESPRATRLA